MIEITCVVIRVHRVIKVTQRKFEHLVTLLSLKNQMAN
jgi:hypothetical protein